MKSFLILAAVVALTAVAFQNCGGKMHSADNGSSNAVTPPPDQPLNTQDLLKTAEASIASVVNNAGTTVQQLGIAVQSLQVLLLQVQGLNLTGQPPEILQLQQQVIQLLQNNIANLQAAIANINTSPNPNPAPAPAQSTLPCQGTFLFSWFGNPPIMVKMAEAVDGTVSYPDGTFPLFIQKPSAPPLISKCVNGVFTKGTFYAGAFWSVECSGAYTVTNGKTSINGTCQYVGYPYPDGTWSAIQQ